MQASFAVQFGCLQMILHGSGRRIRLR
jgi:hypothetical protein